MKFFTVTALLAAALLSAGLAVPFLPAAKLQSNAFKLEARIKSDVSGRFQIFYDDGSGPREELSGTAQLTGSNETTTHILPLAPGRYHSLRLDPLDRPGRVVIESLRVISQSGDQLADLPLRDFKPVQQVQALTNQGASAIEIAIANGNDDPQLTLALAPALVITSSWLHVVRDALPLVLPFFAAFALGLFTLDRTPRFRAAFGARWRQLGTRPQRAIGAAALLAVIVSAYPVVFLGKSHVSPNLGTTLLYDNFPTLPGYNSGEVVDVKLSDVGAVMWQHVPFSMIQHRALMGGELPLWNRYNAAGVPLLAQGQSMAGDPLHLLVVLANGAAWAWDLKYLIAKWLFATGLGLTVLTLTTPRYDRERGVEAKPAGAASRPPGTLTAALAVAISAPFVGFFLYRINHPAFFSLCYAPWPLYCLTRIANSTTRKSVAWWVAGLMIANLALMNSGTVKEAYMLLLCVNFSGACVLLATAAPWRERLGKVAAVAWGGVLFGLITLPIWATFLHTLKSSYTGYNTASAFQIQPTLLLGAFDEIFYRPLMAQDRVFSPSLNFVLLLGVLYFLATLRTQFANRAVTALAASSLVPLSLAFGLIPPHWIVTLPFLSNIAHLDNTFSCVLIVLWSVIAGVGFATAARRLGSAEGRNDLIIAGLLLGALVFGWIAFRQAAHRPIFGPIFTVHAPDQVLPITPFIWNYLAVLLIAACALAVITRGALRTRVCSPARGFLLTLCLFALLWRHGLHASTVGFESFTARPTLRVDFHARSGAMEFARTAHAREPGRGFGLLGNFFPGWTGVYGLETVHGPDALVNPWLRELAGVSGVERLWDWRLYVEAGTLAKAQPFLDALNVRFYFDLLTKDPALAQSLTFVKGADLDVYESPTAWPRAFFTNRVETYAAPADLVGMFRAAVGSPFAGFQQSDATAMAAVARLPKAAATKTATPATGYRLKENSTSFRVRAEGPGVIVLTESYWPGDFRAEVNGRTQPVLRANHAFRGVLVDQAGDYDVTIRYVPAHFPRAMALSLAGVGLLGLSLFFAGRRTQLT